MPFRGPELGLAGPVVVRQGVPKHLIEPSHRALGRVRLRGGLDDLKKGGLDKILRFRPVLGPGSQEADELLPGIQEVRQHGV